MRGIELERRDPDQWAKVLEGYVPPNAGVPEVVRLARAGMLTESRELLASLDTPSDSNAYGRSMHRWAKGEVALEEGRIGEAIPLLQEGAEGLRHFELSHRFFLACEALSRALDATGRIENALSVLEDASDHLPRAFRGRAYGWMDMRLQLAFLFRKSGRKMEAREIEAELHSLLRYADPDFRYHRQLAQLEKSSSP